MPTPAAHVMGALGAYLAATAPGACGKLRGTSMAWASIAIALVPDVVGLFVAGELPAGLRGVLPGVLMAVAIAGAVPGFRESFWTAWGVLLAAHGSQALVGAAGPSGVAWLWPIESRAWRLGPALLPAAGLSVLNQPLVVALKVIVVEIGILLPLTWTAWVLGRESGAARTKSWLVAYAASWPLGMGLMYWCLRTGGRL